MVRKLACILKVSGSIPGQHSILQTVTYYCCVFKNYILYLVKRNLFSYRKVTHLRLLIRKILFCIYIYLVKTKTKTTCSMQSLICTTHLVILTLTLQNLTKRISKTCRTWCDVIAQNLSIATERLTCLNNFYGVQLRTLPYQVVGPGITPWPPQARCIFFFSLSLYTLFLSPFLHLSNQPQWKY